MSERDDDTPFTHRPYGRDDRRDDATQPYRPAEPGWAQPSPPSSSQHDSPPSYDSPSPYGDPPAYGQQPAYGQEPHPYGPPSPYGNAAYGYAAYAPPPHPSSTLALTMGIIALAGGLICALPILVGPIAWWQGAKAKRAIDREPTRWAGRGPAVAGMVCGIIATVLLGLGVAFFALVVGLVAAGY